MPCRTPLPSLPKASRTDFPRRRSFMKAGAIAGLTAGPALLGACSTLSQIGTKLTGAGPITTYSRTIGDIEVTTLLDGYFPFDLELLENVDPQTLKQILRSAYRAPGEPIPLGVSTHLLRIGDRTVLVGAGAGGQMGLTAGNLQATLAALNIESAQIDDLVLTHMHPDHVGGAVAGDKPAFPNAVLHLSELDAAYWSDTGNMSSAPKPLASFFPFAASVLDAYGDRVNRFSGKVDLGNGISSHPLPGHTPGHTGYRISSGEEQLLIWGDMAMIAAIQFGHPEIGVAFDSDIAAAAATRRRTLDMVTSDRILATGAHLPFPAFGHVIANGDAFRWHAEEWRYG